MAASLATAMGSARFAFFLDERLHDPAEHLDEVGAGAAAGVEDEHAGVGQAVGNVEFLAQDGVHAGDLVLDDFGRGVPDAELLAEFGVEGFEERFVEILHGVGFEELLEEGRAVHAVQGSGGPVEELRRGRGGRVW